MNEKEWRLNSEEDFCKYLDAILNSRIKYILDYKMNILALNKVGSNKNQIIKILKENLDGTSYGAISPDLPIKCKKLLLKYKCQLVECDVEYWSDGSFNPVNRKTIMTKLIADYLFDTKMVCVSFLCNSTIINYDMIKDIIFIFSGLFDFDVWDDKHVDAVVEHAKLYGTKEKYINNNDILKVFKKEKLAKYSLDNDILYHKKFKDRLDWSALLNNPAINVNDIEELARSLSERAISPYFQQNTL